MAHYKTLTQAPLTTATNKTPSRLALVNIDKKVQISTLNTLYNYLEANFPLLVDQKNTSQIYHLHP